jgi:hypothetical protein
MLDDRAAKAPANPSSGRLLAIRILAIAMAVSAIGFGLFTSFLGVVSPAQAPHAFHNVVVASLLIVLSAPPVIAIARKPADATVPLVVLTALGMAGLLTMALALTPDPFTLPFVILVGVLLSLTADRSRWLLQGRPSAMLLILVMAGAIPLTLYAFDQAGLQRVDHTSEHAALFHWVETSFYAMGILFLGLLAGFRPTAFRLAAWSSGLGLALLGAASLAFANRASAPPTPWGLVALAGGLAVIGLSELEMRRAGSLASGRTPVPGG